jgi:hypothetical protein
MDKNREPKFSEYWRKLAVIGLVPTLFVWGMTANQGHHKALDFLELWAAWSLLGVPILFFLGLLAWNWLNDK